MLNFLCHTITAYAEKVQPMIQNFEIGLQCNLFFHFIQAIQVRVDNFFTVDTDDMWMGGRLVSIISVASIREPELKNFTY